MKGVDAGLWDPPREREGHHGQPRLILPFSDGYNPELQAANRHTSCAISFCGASAATVVLLLLPRVHPGAGHLLSGVCQRALHDAGGGAEHGIDGDDAKDAKREGEDDKAIPHGEIILSAWSERKLTIRISAFGLNRSVDEGTPRSFRTGALVTRSIALCSRSARQRRERR